jgi:hypothetical protein
MKRFCALVILCFLAASHINAQEKIDNNIEIDKLVHNFGDIAIDMGPVSCEFKIKNIGNKPTVIYNVVTSCGCTKAEWTKEPIKPGETGKVTVVYKNEDGPYPFDKNITLYISDIQKPVILKIRGVAIETMKSISELYPIHYGPLGLKSSTIECGYLEQKKTKTETVLIANISKEPIDVNFTNLSKNLSVSIHPNPIPGESTAEMQLSITANKDKWGKNEYKFTPVINQKAHNNITANAFTKANFDDLTEDEKEKAAMPQFDGSTFSFGQVEVGRVITATFTFKNMGNTPFCVYKVDIDACSYSHSDIPVAAPGEEVSFRVHLDTKDFPKGDCFKIVSLTTNSPFRPIVNLFIAGVLK